MAKFDGTARRMAAGCCAALLVSACAAGPSAGGASSTPSSSSAATTGATRYVVAGPIDSGRYYFDRGPYAAVRFTFTMPAGWIAQNGGRTISKHPDEPGEVGWGPFVITDIYNDACGLDGVLTEVGPTVDDLAGALAAQPGPVASEPVDITLGGYPAKRVDLTVPADLDVSTCRIPIGLQIWLDASGGKYLLIDHGVTTTVYIVDVTGDRLVLTTGYKTTSAPEDIAEMEAIIASIQLDP